MTHSFPFDGGLIHLAWVGYSFRGRRLGRVRVFLDPLSPVDAETGQPWQKWAWSCDVEETLPTLEITMVQSFTLEAPGGGRVPMPSLLRMRIVRALAAAARSLGATEGPRWEDWQLARGRKRRAGIRPNP